MSRRGPFFLLHPVLITLINFERVRFIIFFRKNHSGSIVKKLLRENLRESMVKVKRARKILLARANERLKVLPSFFREFVGKTY